MMCTYLSGVFNDVHLLQRGAPATRSSSGGMPWRPCESSIGSASRPCARVFSDVHLYEWCFEWRSLCHKRLDCFFAWCQQCSKRQHRQTLRALVLCAWVDCVNGMPRIFCYLQADRPYRIHFPSTDFLSKHYVLGFTLISSGLQACAHHL